MDAALHANFGGAARPSLGGATAHFIERQIVRLAANRSRRLSLGERTEGTFVFADIGVVDVTIDDVADRIATDFLPERVSRAGDFTDFAMARAEQALDRRNVEPFLAKRSADDTINVARRPLDDGWKGLHRSVGQAGRPAVAATPTVGIRSSDRCRQH